MILGNPGLPPSSTRAHLLLPPLHSSVSWIQLVTPHPLITLFPTLPLCCVNLFTPFPPRLLPSPWMGGPHAFFFTFVTSKLFSPKGVPPLSFPHPRTQQLNNLGVDTNPPLLQQEVVLVQQVLLHLPLFLPQIYSMCQSFLHPI